MDKNKFSNDYLLKLKSSAITYDDLLKIKSNIVNTKEGVKLIMEHNLLKDLVNLLEKPNEKVLDMTLSILGNCCLNEDSRKEVVCFGIVKKISNVLHSIIKDSVQCRACRLVGNLALETAMAEDLLQESILIDIVSMLETTSKSSRATKQMAVRALRMLWCVEDQRQQMLQLKAVRAVTLLLDLNQKRPDERELLKEIIKALLAFSSDHPVQCAEQVSLSIERLTQVRRRKDVKLLKDVKVVEAFTSTASTTLTSFNNFTSLRLPTWIYGEGSTFKKLVTLTSDATLKKSVLRIICNLCYTKDARLGLGSAGAVQLVIKELKNNEENNLGLFTELVRALCFFCNESVNRAAIRYAGGLPLMLEIIRTSSRTSINPYILHALAQFMYDDISLQELSKGGLVSILVEKIAEFVKDHGQDHVFIETIEENLYGINESHSRFSYRKSRRDESINKDEEKEIPRQRFRANSPSYQEVVREHGISSRCTYQCCVPCDRGCKSESPNMKQFFSLEYMYTGDWSPGSPNSVCCSPDASPPQRGFWGSSPSHSSSGLSPDPSPNERGQDEFDYPEAYSPICSDQEDDNDNGGINNEETKDNDDCGDIMDDEVEDDDFIPIEEPKQNEKENPDTDLRQEHNVLSPALVLLSRLSCMDSPVDELASYSTLSALLDYMILVENPESRAQRILFRIIRNHHYFLSLVQNKFILMIQAKLLDPLHHHPCRKCKHFKKIGLMLYSDIRNLAQSGFGEGELAHQLLKAEESIQRILAISIPYIVKIQRLLVKLLLDCGGLRTLIDILKTDIKEDNDLLNYIPMSLKFLGSSLKIPKLCRDTKDTISYECTKEYSENMEMQLSPITNTDEPSDDKIFLVLDDGTIAGLSKSYLSVQSPVFEAMFRGDFKESQEEKVPLPGISHDCLVNLVKIMKHGRVPEIMPGIDLNVSLELVSTLDRFLIPGSEDISKIIVERFLTIHTALEIYTKCMEAGDVSHFHKLRHETVKFIIMSDEMTVDSKKLYRDILNNPYKFQVLTDIIDIIEERLR